jgi:hypothetical protein
MEVRDFLLSLSEGNKESNLQGYVFAPVNCNVTVTICVYLNLPSFNSVPTKHDVHG